jgi:hypothetical protein
MDDYGFGSSDMDSSLDTSSESALDIEPSVDVPDVTSHDTDSGLQIENVAEQSVIVPDDTDSGPQPTDASDSRVEAEPSVDVPESAGAADSSPDDQVTIHPKRPTVEIPPNPEANEETEPVSTEPTVENRKEKPVPPKGWTPGGPEFG